MNNIKIPRVLLILAGLISIVTMLCCIHISASNKNNSINICDINYSGHDFLKSCFSIGGSYIYLCAYSTDMSEYYMAKMPADGNNFEILPYNIPKNMKVIDIDVDSTGECSVLLSTFYEEVIDGEKLFIFDNKITRIDRIGLNGELKSSLDITDEFKDSEDLPFFFESDEYGNYYIDNGSILMHFSETDNTVDKYPIDGQLYSVTWDENAAYFVYYDYSSGKTMLSSIKDKQINQIAELEEIDDVYATITIIDNVLYLYSREGLYKFDNNKQKCIYKEPNLEEIRSNIFGEDISQNGEVCLLLKTNDKYCIRHLRFK